MAAKVVFRRQRIFDELGKPAPGTVCNNIWGGGSGVCPGWEDEFPPQYPIDYNDMPPLQNPCPAGFHAVALNSGFTGRGRRFVCVQNTGVVTTPPPVDPTIQPPPAVDDDLVFGLVTEQTAWIIGGVGALGAVIYLVSQTGGKA